MKFTKWLQQREHTGTSFVTDESPIVDEKNRGAFPYYSKQEKPPKSMKKCGCKQKKG